MVTIKEQPPIVRDSNFEALRILCMLFIIAGHIIMVYDFDSAADADFYECAVRPYFMVAVNCFVLISGWFGVKRKWSKLLELNDSTTFWTVTIGAVALIYGIHVLDIKKDILMLVPVLSRRYWFITIYMALCVVAPYIKTLTEHLSIKQYTNMLVCLMAMFVALPTLGAFLNFQSISGDSGYGLANFITLYLLGRYMRLYKQPYRSSWIYFLLYFISTSLCGAVQVGFSKVMGFQFTTLLSYDTFFTFVGAVMMFCCFARLNFKSRTINFFAKFCFATYIIHLHPWTFNYVYNDLIGMRDMSVSLMPLCLVGLSFATFVVCSLMEFIRLQMIQLVTKAYRNLRK